jgi:branched-chain amino acid transport system ATP-binding protein
MGHWRARAGQVLLDGQDIAALPTPAVARSGVGYVPENMGIFSDLTVEENMVLAASSGAPDAARLEWLFGVFPPLKTFWKNHAGNLSGGQKQMLSIARAMVEERRLYLIDEPTKGLAPAIISTMVGALRQLKEQGASILLVEQNFSVARALGDRAVVMDDGRVTWTGAMADLAGDAGLQERLMGLSMEAGS